jgi:hypothetical protein
MKNGGADVPGQVHRPFHHQPRRGGPIGNPVLLKGALAATPGPPVDRYPGGITAARLCAGTPTSSV